MSLFSEFINSTKTFWNEVSKNKKTNGNALIEISLSDSRHLYGVLKIALVLSRLEKLSPVVFPSLLISKRNKTIIQAMCRNVVAARLEMFVHLIRNIRYLIGVQFSIRNQKDLLNLDIGEARIGQYIYDSCYRPLIVKLGLKTRIKVFYLLTLFFAYQAVLRKREINMVFIPDPGYQGGVLFELCRVNNIKCVNAIDLQRVQLHRYREKSDFEFHYSWVDDQILDQVPAGEKLDSVLEQYLKKRFSGNIQQHDVLRAYASQKRIYEKADLYREYKLEPGLPLVVVMAHVFSDAPHSYPDMLYENYEEWLIFTVKALSNNSRVNFVVKEHPSFDLYFEEGILLKKLNALGYQRFLLKSDVHTATILQSADCVITCGGTIGIEFSAMGKPVVLAAKPPYSGRGITIEPTSRHEYEDLLANRIQDVPELAPDQLALARKLAFVMLELMDNHDEKYELGGERYGLGKKTDINEFYKAVIKENLVALSEQHIYRLLEKVIGSNDTLIINWEKTRS